MKNGVADPTNFRLCLSHKNIEAFVIKRREKGKFCGYMGGAVVAYLRQLILRSCYGHPGFCARYQGLDVYRMIFHCSIRLYGLMRRQIAGFFRKIPNWSTGGRNEQPGPYIIVSG